MGLINTLSGVDIARFGIASLSLVPEGKALITSQWERAFGKPGISGLIFDIELNNNISHTSQVTDHWTEENSAIQDHQAFEPVKYTITGKIGELVFKTEPALAFAQATADRLSPLGVFSPTQSLKATEAIAASYQAISVITQTKRVWDSMAAMFKGAPAQNNQAQAYALIENFYYARTAMTIDTPWRRYSNMILESWSAEQDETTTMETLFTLNFKQIRVVGVEVNMGALQGRNVSQMSPLKATGDTQGEASTLFKITH